MKEDKNIYIHVLVNEQLKKELLKEAELRQLSLASYIRQIILDRRKIN